MTAADPQHPLADPLRWLADPLRWLGAGLLLAAFATRALATTSELPGWDLDPTIIATPLSGIGPAWSFWLDAAAILGAGLALLGEAGAGRAIRPWPLVLTSIGVASVVWHGWFSPNATLGDRRIGVSWAAAMLGAVACWHLCRDPRYRRLVAAAVLGMIAVLAVKGAQDVFIAHPRTVEQFQQQRDTFFAAQGWSAESPMARSYERRLKQPEASGWFGLANVYASFAAASMVATLVLLAAWLVRLRHTGTPRAELPAAAPIALGLILSTGALVLSGTKGGFIAAGAGAMGVGVLLLVIRRVRAGSPASWPSSAAAFVGFFAVVGPLLLVISRGLVGENLGDRSLLFRWFYFQAAARISAENPILGVGPDSFQAAYLIAKNPISPEDVRSPHSILFDWTATLGLVALLSWGILWLYWVCEASRRPLRIAALPAAAAHDTRPLRPEFRAVGLIAAVATLLATFIDRAHATPDVATVRLVGLVAWCILAWGIIAAGRHALAMSLALAGTALTLAAHAQIDVTPSLPASAGLLMVLIAAAASPDGAAPPTPQPSPARRSLSLAPGVLLTAAAGLLAVTTALPAARWEATLENAASAARPVAEIGDLYREVRLAEDVQARRTLQTRLLTDLGLHLGRRVEASSAGIEAAIAELEFTQLRAAASNLEAASAMEPSEWRTRREASRLYIRLAAQLARAGRSEDAARLLDHAAAVARADAPPGLRIPPPGASELAWLGLAYRTSHEIAPQDEKLRQAAAAYEAAAVLDPYNTELAAQLFDLHRRLGNPTVAATWARRTLELDDLSRLDTDARALPPERRAAIEGALPPP